MSPYMMPCADYTFTNYLGSGFYLELMSLALGRYKLGKKINSRTKAASENHLSNIPFSLLASSN